MLLRVAARKMRRSKLTKVQMNCNRIYTRVAASELKETAVKTNEQFQKLVLFFPFHTKTTEACKVANIESIQSKK